MRDKIGMLGMSMLIFGSLYLIARIGMELTNWIHDNYTGTNAVLLTQGVILLTIILVLTFIYFVAKFGRKLLGDSIIKAIKYATYVFALFSAPICLWYLLRLLSIASMAPELFYSVVTPHIFSFASPIFILCLLCIFLVYKQLLIRMWSTKKVVRQNE